MTISVSSTQPDHSNGGPPLVFVHGAWHAGWCWDPFVGFFTELGYHTHALDLQGHGDSPGNLRWSRISDYVGNVAEVVASLDTAPVLVGHSMGGLIVQHYLAANGVRAGVLVAPVPTRGAIGATWRAARRHPLAFLRSNLTFSLGPMVDDPDRAAGLLFGPNADPGVVAATVERLGSESYPAYLDMIFRRPKPQLVTDPVLVLGATEDALFSVAEIRATAKRYGTEAVLFDGMGHDMMLDAGWQEPAQVVADWLAGLPDADPGR
ncbi:MAG: alpha/beta fold hydrolase [Acidimicrobiia bacterium]